MIRKRVGEIGLVIFALGLMLALASCAPPPPTETGALDAKGFLINTVFFFLTAFGVYWLLVLRPLQLKDQAKSKFIEGLKRGHEVVTSGGILGKVQSIGESEISIEVAPNVKLRVRPEHVHPLQEVDSSSKDRAKDQSKEQESGSANKKK